MSCKQSTIFFQILQISPILCNYRWRPLNRFLSHFLSLKGLKKVDLFKSGNLCLNFFLWMYFHTNFYSSLQVKVKSHSSQNFKISGFESFDSPTYTIKICGRPLGRTIILNSPVTTISLQYIMRGSSYIRSVLIGIK